MLTQLTTRAAAKINLALDVLGKREDGYHDLRMLMQSVSLYDELTLTLQERGGCFTADSNARHVPPDLRNLALRAARLYLSRTGREDWGCTLHIHKNIPVCAGMGGGSSDAAAVLRVLNQHFGHPVPKATLADWGLEIGSDVPFCLQGGLCLAQGRGERLTPLSPLPHCTYVLTTPPIVVSTPVIFELLDRLPIPFRPDWPGLETAVINGDPATLARRLYNVFEPPVTEQYRVIGELRKTMMDYAALGVVMSGTGPTVAGMFAQRERAQAAAAALKEHFPNTFVAEPLPGC